MCNFGDIDSIKGEPGLFEMRIHVGRGYRVYFGEFDGQVVILILGGPKKTQTADIKKAGAALRWLQNKAAQAYLSFAAQSGSAEHFKAAIKTAARAEKMAKLAENAGMTREGAYKSLKPGTKTQLQTALSTRRARHGSQDRPKGVFGRRQQIRPGSISCHW